MAKQLFLTNVAAKTHRGNKDACLDGTARWWNPLSLVEARLPGAITSLGTAIPVPGTSNGIEVCRATDSTIKCEWLSEPLAADFTIAGTITLNLWAMELAMTDNIAINATIFKLDGATRALTQIAKTARVTELGTSQAAANFTVTPTSTACKRGDRIRVVIWGDDVGGFGSSAQFNFNYDAATAGISGDSYVQFTENLTFEPAGDPGAILSQTVAGLDASVGYTAAQRLSQSFVAIDDTIYEMSLRLSIVGSPTDNLIVEIQSDSAGNPSGTALATVATIPASSLTGTMTDYVWSNLGIGGLTIGATYHIVVRRSGALDSGNYFGLRVVGVGQAGWNPYKTYNGSTWAASNGPFVCRIQGFAISTYYLTDTDETAISGANAEKQAKTTRGGGAVTRTTFTAAGPTAGIQIVDGGGSGNPLEWYTPPLNAFTLGGKSKFNIRGSESNNSAFASMRAEIAVVNGDGTGAVVWGSACLDYSSGAMPTTDGTRVAWVAGDDIAVTTGQRLRMRLFLDDSPDIALGSGFTVTVGYNGATANAAGDTYVILPQAVTEQITSTPIAGTDANGTTTESASIDKVQHTVTDVGSSLPVVLENVIDAGYLNFGISNNSQRMQFWVTAQGSVLDEIRVWLNKLGAPTATGIQVDVYLNAGGYLGAVVGSATIPANSITTTMTQFVLSSLNIPVSKGDQYGIVIYPVPYPGSLSASPSDCFNIRVGTPMTAGISDISYDTGSIAQPYFNYNATMKFTFPSEIGVATSLDRSILGTDSNGVTIEAIGSRVLGSNEIATATETLGNRVLAVADSNVSVIGAIPPFSGNTFGIGSFASNAKIAQSFRFGSDFTIGSLLLYLVRFGTTVDNSIFEIQTDNAGSPSGTVLGTYTVASSAIPSSAAWIQMVGTIPGLSLTANTTYWIVASRSGAIDSGKDVEWVFTSPSVYADGNKAGWDGSFWAPDFTVDVGFQLTPSMESAVASQPVSKSGSDSNGATTETQIEVATYSATDTSGTITESTSIVSVTPISATDTNGVTIEVATPKAVPAVTDTNGVVSETIALVSALAVPDINGVVTEATPLTAKPQATDVNGVVTETTGIVQVNPVSATDSNSTTTETGVPKAVPAVTDVNSATTEAIGNTAKATLDINSTVIESASLSTVNQISGTDANGATTENITQVASATTTDSGTGTDTQSVDQGALPKASSDTNSTTTEVAGVTKAPLSISGLALWFDASQLSLAGGATLKDDYNRTNASTLGPNWAQVTSIGSNRLAVNGNEAKASGSTYADAWTPQTYGSDQEVTLTLKTIDYSAPHTWLLLQMPDPAMGSFTGYLLDIVTGFDHYVLTLYRGNAGSYTNLFSVDPISYGHGGTGVGDVWTIRKVGALITVLLNGSPVAGFPITDPAPLTATTTYVGTGGSGSSNSTFDDFMAGVPGAGTAVTEWPNLSNPSLPGPMVGTPVPQLRANALNSMPVVRFAANEGRLRMNGTSGLGTDYTLVYVGRIWGATNGRVVNGIYPPANILFGWWTSYQDVAYAEGFTTPDVKIPFTNDWKMYSADGVSGLQRFLSDGTLLGSTTTGTGWQNTFGISGYSPTGLEETADCEVAEVLVYNRKLSDVERQQVEGYLRTKWFPGVAVSANDNNIGVNESVTQVAAESATDTNSVTVEAVSKIAVIATDANVGVTESVAMARQVADVNGGTTETASNGAPIAATDTNGVTTESIAGRSATLSDVNSVVSESATYIVKTTITDVSSTITETTALVNKTTTGDNNSVVSELVSLRLAASDINGTTTEFAKTSRLVFDSSSPTADFATVTLIQLTDGDYGTATESASLFKQFIGGTFTVGRGRIIRRSSGKVTLNDKGRVPTSEAYGKVNLDDEGRMQRETTGRAS